MNRDFLCFFVYLVSVLLLTVFHDMRFMAFSALVLAAFSGRSFVKLLKKTFFALLLFNSAVSISYILLSLSQGRPFLVPLLRINVRTSLLTFAAFLLIERVNLFSAFSFSKTLTYLLTLSYSQILTFRKILAELTLSLKSRTITRPGRKDLYRFVSSAVYLFLDRAIHNSREISQAMKSRGFRND